MDRLTIIVTLVTINAALVRAFREDVRFWPSIRAPWRDVLVAGLTLIVAPALDMLTQGTAFGVAAVTAILAALPTLITLIVSILATPQTAAQVATQASANRAASIKPPPLACLMLCVAMATGAAGCKQLLPIITDVLVAIQDASVILDAVTAAEQSYFREQPNPDAQAKVEAAIVKASLALDVSLRIARGSRDLSQQDASQAFAEFRVAYGELEALLLDLGIVQRQGRVMALRGGARLQLPTPIALEAK